MTALPLDEALDEAAASPRFFGRGGRSLWR
jgi:hypothetical protein